MHTKCETIEEIIMTKIYISMLLAFSLIAGVFALDTKAEDILPQDDRPYLNVRTFSKSHPKGQMLKSMANARNIAFVQVIDDIKKDNSHVIRTYKVIVPVGTTFKKGDILTETVYYEGGLYSADGKLRILRFKPNSILFIQSACKESTEKKGHYIVDIPPAYFFEEEYEKEWESIHKKYPEILPKIP